MLCNHSAIYILPTEFSTSIFVPKNDMVKSSKFPSHPLTQAEGFGHIENYYRSGLRPCEYYKAHDITEWQFYSWRKRYLQTHPHPQVAPAAGTGKILHKVRIDDASDFRFSGLEIHYPQGVKLVIGSGQFLAIEQLRVLIQLCV